MDDGENGWDVNCLGFEDEGCSLSAKGIRAAWFNRATDWMNQGRPTACREGSYHAYEYQIMKRVPTPVAI